MPVDQDERTGAMFAILKGAKGECIEEPPHSHPHANQITFILSGEVEYPNGMRISAAEGNYMFMYHTKNEKYGAMPKGTKALSDVIYLHYWDDTDDD